MNIQKQKQIISYLKKFEETDTLDKYLEYESKRIKNLSKISPLVWINKLVEQEMKCFYCGTDLKIIQSLLLAKVINPRKRGKYGYSGMHFEIDHKNANKHDNSNENIVAACYYCNNDKSNTISHEIFKKYFGKQKSISFLSLIKDKGINIEKLYRHNLTHNN